VPLEAAPNEVFYTFHKDEIDAEALLHPCKVAFLPKGAELQPGISSFLCRRVYDIANKCLWWLNDQDYINVSFFFHMFPSVMIFFGGAQSFLSLFCPHHPRIVKKK